MANYCLNINGFSAQEKQAFEILTKTVESYGLSKGAARLKVSSYIEELSERYFTGNNKNKENIEDATSEILKNIITLSQPNKIGDKIVSNTLDLKNDVDINAVQTKIKPEFQLIDKDTPYKSNILYVTRNQNEGSGSGVYSDTFAFKHKTKENIIEFENGDYKKVHLKITEKMLSGKYKKLVFAEDLNNYIKADDLQYCKEPEYDNRQLPTNEEVRNAMSKMRLSTRGYKENGIYAEVKIQDAEGRLFKKRINFWSIFHKELWETAKMVRSRVNEYYPRLKELEDIITQLETIPKPENESDYYYSFDDEGVPRESTLEKINNLYYKLICIPPDLVFRQGLKNLVQRHLKSYIDPKGSNHQKHLNNIVFATENDKRTIDYLVSTGYDKLTYDGKENDFTKQMTAIREIHKKGSNYAQYTYTSLDVDPRQPFNTLNTLAFKIVNIKAPLKFEFGYNVKYKNKSNLVNTYSSKDIADLTEAVATAIDVWLMPLPLWGVDSLASDQMAVVLGREIKKCQDIIDSNTATEEDKKLAYEKINILNTKISNYKKYTPEDWIKEYGGIQEVANRVYTYLCRKGAPFQSKIETIEEAGYTVEEAQKIIERRDSLLDKLDSSQLSEGVPKLFIELFNRALQKSSSLHGYILDERFKDLNINISESEEIEDIEESGWADPGINKPAFTSKTSDTVTKEVRDVLSKIPMADSKGRPVYNVLGNMKFLNFTSAYGKIQDLCSDKLITTSEDIITILANNLGTEPWLRLVIFMLKKDKQLAAKFVNAFNVDFIRSVDQSDFKETTLNMHSGAVSLMDTWSKSIQEDNYVLDKIIFDNGGNINVEKVKDIDFSALKKNKDIQSLLYAIGIKNISVEALDKLSDFHKNNIIKLVINVVSNVSIQDKNTAKNIMAANRPEYLQLAKALANVIHTESADSSYNVTVDSKIVQRFSYTYNSKLGRMSQKIDGAFKTHDIAEIKGNNLMIDESSSPLLTAVQKQNENSENYGELTYVATMEGQEISNVVDSNVYYKNAFYQFSKKSNEYSANYYIAPLSDSGNLLAIRMPKIDVLSTYRKGDEGDFLLIGESEEMKGIELIHAYIKNAITQELYRIIRVENGETSLINVKGYAEAGEHFHKLPELDNYITELSTILLDEKKTTIDYENRLDEILFADVEEGAGEDGIITKLIKGTIEELKPILENKFEREGLPLADRVEEFFLNNLLAQWNINDIMFKDMAFFKYNGVSSTADFIKRIKGLFGRTTKGDISQLDSPYCRTIYVKFGIRKEHPVQGYIEEILSKSSIGGTAEEKVIKNVWKSAIEGADGQGFMTAKGLKAWGKLYGYDSEYIEGFLERAKNQQLTAEDYNFVFSIKKPYIYTFVRDPESGQDIPTIVKNSLALLIPGLTPPNTIYDALMQFAGTHDLDQIQLDSAVKIGGNHIFDIDEMLAEKPDMTSEGLVSEMEETMYMWDEEAELPHIGESTAIHEIPYEDFGEQTRTETQHDKIKLGIQVMKVMFSDIKNEQAVAAKFNGKDLNGTEYKNIYLSALAAKLNLNYNKVAGVFAQSDTLEHALKSLAISSGKFTTNDLQDIDLSDENVLLGAIAPTHLNKYYTLVRGLAKHIAEVNVPGKTMIQMSGVAYDEDLHIVFEDVATGTEIISNEANIGTLKDLLKEGKLRIKHIDAYCGVYNNDLFKAVLNENGIIDEEAVKNLPDEVKEFMAYRVPTEGNCSVFPCKIKKFLNRYAGDAIVLPKEIILINGSNFEMDKDFCHFPEITVRPNAKKNIEDPKTAYEIYKQELNEKYGKTAELNMLSFDNWIMQNKDKYYFTAKKVKYDTEGDIAENLRQGKYKKKEINNILFDLHMSRLRAQDSTYNMFVSSNFEMVKKISNLMTIATNIHSIDVNNIKNEKLKDIVTEFKNAIKSDNEEFDPTKKGQKTLEVFNKYWDSSEIYETEALGIEENFEVLPIADIREMWKNLDQNSQGSSIIGRFAILKATLSQIQGSGMTINPVFGVSLDGIKYNNISDISVAEKSILKNFVAAQFLAAAVDNGKDPRAGKLNINSITVNTVTTMIALGMPMEKIALVMAHPAIKELTETCKKTGLKFSAKTLENNVSFDKNISGLTSGKLLLDIVSNSRTSDKAVLGLMHKIMKISEDMTRLTMALRSDKASAGLPSLSIYAAVNTVRSTRKFIDDLNTGKTVFMLPENSRFFENLDNIASNSTNILPDLNTELGDKGFGQNRAYPNFFRLFGTVLPYRLMSSRFFEFSENAEYILDQVESNLGISLYANDIKNVLQAWVRYNMMKLPTFADEYTKEGEFVRSSSDKFELYLKGFPKYFVKTALDLKKLPEFKDNYILSNIGKYLAGSDRLAVNSLNKLDKSTIEQAQNSWKELLESKDKKARDLGMGLYVYMLYTNGGYFEAVGFSQFSTIDMMNLIPGYTEILQSLSKNKPTDEDILNFIVQAAANNVVDAKAVTEKSPYSVNTTYGKNFGKDNTIQIMNKSNQPLPLLLRVATKEEGEEKKTTKLYMFIEDSNPYITQNKDVYTQGIYKKVPDIKYKPKYEYYTLNMNPNIKWNNAEFDDNRLRPISIKENGTEYLLEEELSVIINDIEQL